MNVLSLFDGISCGQVALKRVGNGWTVDVIAHLFEPLKNKFVQPAQKEFFRNQLEFAW